MKRFFVFILLFMTFILSVNTVFSDDTRELYLENNGWCPGIDIEFKVYNYSDYLLRDEVDDDDDDIYIRNISDFDVTVYNGPFSSLPVLLETETSKTGTFTVNFPTSNNYLIEIAREENYTRYSQSFSVRECRFAQDQEEEELNETEDNSEEETQEEVTEDKTFYYLNNKIVLNFIETSIESGNDINVVQADEEYLEEIEVEKPQKFWQGFVISGSQDFGSLNIEYSIEDGNNIEKLLYFNPDTETWEEENNFQITDNNVRILDSKLGLYAFTGVNIPTEEELAAQEEEQVIDLSNTQSNQSNNDTGQAIRIFGGIIIGILGLLGMIFLIFKMVIAKNKKKEKENDFSDFGKEQDKKDVIDNNKHSEELNSYNDIYKKTKDYVLTYKEQYKKDQIYRALERAHIPKDVIDKVFLEVYE